MPIDTTSHLGVGEGIDASNAVLRQPTSSATPHVLLWVVQMVALTLPPFRGRRELFVAVVLALASHAQLNPHFSNNLSLVQPAAISWSFYLSTLEKFLSSGDAEVEGTFWRIDRPEKEALAYGAFTISKLRWASMLMFNQRLIRWNRQVKNVPPLQQSSRTSFLTRRLYELVRNVLVVDLLSQLWLRLFYTSPGGEVGMVNSKFLSLRHSDWRLDLVRCLVFGALPY